MKRTLLRLHLVIAFILLGGFAISAQVLLIRKFLVVFYGNRLYLGIVFAIWLSGITTGAFLESRIINRSGDRLRFFLFIQALICLLLPMEFYLIKIHKEGL